MKTTKFCFVANVLHLAARGGHADTVETLLNIGLDVDEQVSYHCQDIKEEENFETELDPHCSSFEADEEAEDLYSLIQVALHH